MGHFSQHRSLQHIDEAQSVSPQQEQTNIYSNSTSHKRKNPIRHSHSHSLFLLLLTYTPSATLTRELNPPHTSLSTFVLHQHLTALIILESYPSSALHCTPSSSLLCVIFNLTTLIITFSSKPVALRKMGHFNFSYSLFFLVITIFELSFRAESRTFWGDTEVLKQLKNGLDPDSVSPGSCVSSWDFNLDPCDALFSDRFTCGFRCDAVVAGESRVTELSLDQAGYSGSLTSSTWNLPYLETLDISNNLFSGPIPASLSNLTRLRRLALSRNSFTGEIPAAIGSSLSNLQELYLDSNYLEGAVPASFNGLVSLNRLEIQSNNLSGRFPELGSLQNLTFLDASDNAISGEFPSALPPSVVQITLRNNKLQGTIPDWLKNLGFLQVLDLTNNQLGGSIPATLFEHRSLQQLTLSLNQFSTIQTPKSLGTQSELVAVDLSSNDLQGLLPAFLALMPKLSALSLENNRFTGMIPTQYAIKTAVPGAGVSQFSRLLLGGNYLFGVIPSPLMGLKPGSANVRLVDNCLFRCPASFFFCQGGDQKSPTECRVFGPVIP